MNILFVVHGYKPAYKIGGPIISVSSLAEALTRKGHKVTVFTTNCNLSENLDVPVNCPQTVDGIEVWYFKRYEPLKIIFPFASYLSKSMGFLYAPEMAKQLEPLMPSFDLVHTHLPFIYPTYAAAKAAKKFKKPLFYNQRGVLDPARLKFRSVKKKFYLNFIEKPILRAATTLIALTPAEQQSFSNLCPSAFCSVIPNGVNVKEYLTFTEETTLSEITDNKTVVLFMGRLHPIKGADRLIEAFINIRDQIKDVILIMAGPDEFHIQEKFMKRVNALGMQKSILFPGMVSGNLKKNLLARANLFCLPSDAEGFSMAILEALASQTAVMISPGCHFPEVETAGCGVVVENEVEKIAKTLCNLINNKEQLLLMGKNGRNLVTNNYDWNSIADKYVEVYEEGLVRQRKLLNARSSE